MKGPRPSPCTGGDVTEDLISVVNVEICRGTIDRETPDPATHG